MPFFIFFIILPLTEIWLFAGVWDLIGLPLTLLALLLSACFGMVLLREQGLAALFSARSQFRDRELPLQAAFDGLCVTLAGLLLIMPGFLTDGVALLLLWPATRGWVKRMLIRFLGLESFSTGASVRTESAIDAEFSRVEEPPPALPPEGREER